MTMKKTALFLSMLASAALLPGANAFADTINLSFTNPVQTGSAGATLTFEANVVIPNSKGGSIYLNADSYTATPAGAVLDDSNFYTTFPLSMDPGDSFTGDAFTITLPSIVGPGAYLGSFEILGGTDPNALDVIGTATFEIDVPPSVPEPGSWVLFATGLGAVAVAVYSSRGALQS
jgi:hypothetical protein